MWKLNVKEELLIMYYERSKSFRPAHSVTDIPNSGRSSKAYYYTCLVCIGALVYTYIPTSCNRNFVRFRFSTRPGFAVRVCQIHLRPNQYRTVVTFGRNEFLYSHMYIVLHVICIALLYPSCHR